MTTKICGNCSIKIDSIIHFRELCASTDFRIRLLLESPNENDLSTIGIEESALAVGAGLMADENYEIVSTRKRGRTELDSNNSES